jgi:hypothetical protein
VLLRTKSADEIPQKWTVGEVVGDDLQMDSRADKPLE